MRKGKYNISIVKVENNKRVRELIKVNGYIVEFGNNIYGIDHRWQNGWVITELRSGYQVAYPIPRLKDFWTTMSRELDEKVSRALSNYSGEFVNDIDKM